MNWIRNHITLAVVAMTGAAVLVIEVLAVRILSPYYGNTIYSVSSVIGVILAALSFGYYAGGRVADRHPHPRWFYGIIALGGFSVLFLEFLTATFLPLAAESFSFTVGPLIAAFILFFLPSFLLGLLSPFAIKLQHEREPHRGIGTVSGAVFFWSTAGSIAGSLSAGFLLIPRFGISAILVATGLILSAIGLVGIVVNGGGRRVKIFFIAGALAAGSIASASLALVREAEGVIYLKDGLYERIAIYDREYKGHPTRFFQQDLSSSAAMFLDSDEFVYDYTNYLRLYKLFKPDIRRLLVLGSGVQLIPKVFLKELPGARIDSVEIEPSLFELGRRFFGVREDPRLTSVIEDGRRFLAKNPERYDVIISDAYISLYSVPIQMTTREFFELARRRLNHDGVFMANVIGTISRSSPSFLLSEMKTFRSVFPSSYFFAVKSPHSREPQNVIFVGFNHDDTAKKLDRAPEVFAQGDMFQNLKNQIIDLDRFNLSEEIVLSDDYAPVENLIAGTIKKIDAEPKLFDGDEALALVRSQLQLGPRYLGSAGHDALKKIIQKEMAALTDEVSAMEWDHESRDGTLYHLTNIIARLNPAAERRIILATHYDTRRYADRDEKTPEAPLAGANDGASGVAVLLETARSIALQNTIPAVGIDFIFFDGEEGEPGVSDTAWQPLGSMRFAQEVQKMYPGTKPFLGIVLDMVCDKNLNIYRERFSERRAGTFVDDFWRLAREKAPENFIDEAGSEIWDDHVQLTEAGIPSFLVIDFDYPPFHTTRDTIDQCSAHSLETVGSTLLRYLGTLK